MKNLNNLFIKAITDRTPAQKIVATFTNGAQVGYTMQIFDLLTSDPAVVNIYDAETGEVLFYR